uniref:Uncharacterized protein n=1 Tax=Pseudo-nitzschia australis TaxID=44445 RepID=A0A7S4AGX9_9STRA|mmetsp:Transcript_1272/g.2579  ORF Transcript_1272/g.2579 Transcript_1272/m.2579 type:complete len:476 (+) Transcript_1272:110-1537(+)
MMRSSQKLLFAFIFTAIGYYLGSLHTLATYGDHSSSTPIETYLSQSQSQSHLSKIAQSKGQRNITEINGSRDEIEDASAFRLHEHIHLSEDLDLYRKLVHPPLRELLEKGEVADCPTDPVKPYFDILKNIDENPLFYEDDHGGKNSDQTCPVVFLFYFEGGSKVARTFFDFYSNIQTKRCLNFIVSSRWIESEETRDIVDTHGYTIVGKHYPKQDKTISMSLHAIKEQYGDDVLVSVNDLDHLLVWFDLEGKPHRYSSYTDMVRLYVYELLSTPGCSDQNVYEKYVVPCTCLMKENKKYTSTIQDDVLWSEYGVTNRFHPTANFYLNRSMEIRAEKRDSEYAYSIGTVFSNLRKYDGDIITHHKICWRTKKVYSRAKMCGIIHARSDNMVQSLAKYQHFLQAAELNIYRSNSATIGDAMGCSVVDTHGIIENERTCRKVKEFANILAIGHQKLACLNAGYSEEHCTSDMSCCLTY